LAVTQLIGTELDRQPKSGETIGAINRLVERFPQLDYTTGRLHERIFAPHFRSVVGRFAYSSNRLTLVAPASLLVVIDELATLMSKASEADNGWTREWNDAQARLVAGTRDFLGAPPVRRARLRARLRLPWRRRRNSEGSDYRRRAKRFEEARLNDGIRGLTAPDTPTRLRAEARHAASLGLRSNKTPFSGGGGIRTHEGPEWPLPVFKTGAFNRSATPPGQG
jgi:hypothetical protein